jgi:Big-like domain-containing protein
MKNCIGKFFIILIGVLLQGKTYSDALTFNHEISVIKSQSLAETIPTQSVCQYTPPAPYNNVTFTITAPVKVTVGQTFIIDYTIQVSKFTFISYWSDLIPDLAQGANAKLIDINYPSIGIFNIDENSRARKGAKGVWSFPQGLPGPSVQHLKIKMQATSAGLLKFSTLLATNPPINITTSGTVVSCQPFVVDSIIVQGLSDQSLEISILDYVTADSKLQVSSISGASYGSTNLNEDYTVTYMPSRGFYGQDSFTYKVTDGTKIINGIVRIIINQSPIPEIIQ